MEEWRDIEGYEGKYQISNYGNCKSLCRTRTSKNGSLSIVKERLLKGKIDKDGYVEYALSNNGKLKSYRAHRLVAQAFIPNPNNLPWINHKDENPSNNSVSNLEWCDAVYNRNYSIRKVSKPIRYNETLYPSIRECSRQLGVDIKVIRWHLSHNTPYKNHLFQFAATVAA